MARGADGSRQMTAQVDSTATGQKFVNAQISQNGQAVSGLRLICFELELMRTSLSFPMTRLLRRLVPKNSSLPCLLVRSVQEVRREILVLW